MTIKVSNFKLGLFIITGASLLVILIVLFGAGAFSAKGRVIETYIDGSVQGLDVGSPLKLRGVTIGRVTEIGLIDQYYAVEEKFARYVVVRMEIDPAKQRTSNDSQARARIESWVKSGMRLHLTTLGITGVAFMEADVDPKAEPPLEIAWTPSVIYVPSRPAQFDRLLDSVERLASQLQEANIPRMAGDIERFLATVDRTVADANVKELSDQVRATLAEVRGTISDPEFKHLAPRVVSTMDDLKKATADVNGNVTRVSGELSTIIGESRAAVKDVQQTIKRPEVEDSLNRMAEITRRLEATLTRIDASYARKDDQIDHILGDLRAVSANIRDLTELISRYPSLATFGESPTPSKAYKND